MRRGFKIHDQAMMHFVTSTVVQGIPVFTKPCYFQVLVDSFNYCIRHKGLLVYGYVLMPTHFHAVIACEAGLSDVMRDLDLLQRCLLRARVSFTYSCCATRHFGYAGA